MKKRIALLIMCSYTLLSLCFYAYSNVKQEYKPEPLRNTHAHFGKTHFIVGYKHASPVDTLPEEIPSASNKPTKRKYTQKKYTKSAYLLDNSRQTQAFFTSTHNIHSIIATLIDQAEKNIFIAAFALTDPDVAERLKRAHNRGIIIEIITDFANMNEHYSKIKHLVENDIPVFYYRSDLNPNPKQKGSRYARMHHKFLIIDKKMSINGSTNLTKSGQKDNIENIVVMRDQETVDHFVQEFIRIKKQCIPCQKTN